MSAGPHLAPQNGPAAPTNPPAHVASGVSRRIGGVQASATLAIDAKAKALQDVGGRRHRLRRGRARLPDAGRDRRGRRGRLPGPEEPPLHADGGPAGAARGDRRKDPARLGLRGRRRAGDRHERRQARRWRTPSRRCSTRATRCSSPRRTGRRTRSRCALAGGVPVVVPPAEATASRVTLEQLAACGDRAHQGAAVRLAVATRPGRSTRSAAMARSAAVAAERGWWVVTDEIYEHLIYGGAERHSMPVVVPELAERCVVVNGVAEDLRDDRLACRLDDRAAADRRRGARTCRATRPRTSPTSRSSPRSPRSSGDLIRGRGDARGLRPPRAGRSTAC